MGSLRNCCPVVVIAGVVFSVQAIAAAHAVMAQTSPAASTRCVSLEIYFRSSEPRGREAVEAIRQFVRQRPGTGLRTYNLDKEDVGERLRAIGQYFNLPDPPLPFVYGGNQKIAGFQDAQTFRRQLEELLTMTVYVRDGCPRCQRAKEYLAEFAARYPGLEMRFIDILYDPDARTQLAELAQRYRMAGYECPRVSFLRSVDRGIRPGHHRHATRQRYGQMDLRLSRPCRHGCEWYGQRRQAAEPPCAQAFQNHTGPFRQSFADCRAAASLAASLAGASAICSGS